MKACGAQITEPLGRKPWGLTQFTVEGLDGIASTSTAIDCLSMPIGEFVLEGLMLRGRSREPART